MYNAQNLLTTPPAGPPAAQVAVRAPAKKRRRWPWVLAGVGGTLVVLMGGCAALIGGAAKVANDQAAHVAEGGVSSGIGTKDATADVGTPAMSAPDSIGVRYVEVPVTNRSSGRSDYWIDVVIESADGATQYDTTSAIVNDLAAGQSTTAKSLPITKDVPAGAIVQVTTVQRTASN